MKIVSVVGARPNFMKIAPFIRAIDKFNSGQRKIENILVHTGQHYDERMSEAFFRDLGIPEPEINLGIGSGTHAEQVGKTMIEFEKVLRQHNPDWVVVVGDVNATLACSVTAKKENVKVCHIEAGLRSGDMTMPEEINRLVTDRLSDLLLVPDEISLANLRAEGVPEKRMKLVGNIMIDTLNANIKEARRIKLIDIIENNFNHESFLSGYKEIGNKDRFVLLTLHRPSNVDKREVLEALVSFLTGEVVRAMKIIWPMHPRTENNLKEFGLWEKICCNSEIFVLHPVSYRESIRLNSLSKVVLTDSGGLQEECTVLGTPCITLRFNTERPVTLREHGGASVLTGSNIGAIKREFRKAVKAGQNPHRPLLWDGRTAMRCVKAIVNFRSM